MESATAPGVSPHARTTAPPAVREVARQGPPVVPHPAGVNIVPGPEDDGWETPAPVRLSDGTMVQLFKDGEGLLAAYDAIKAAKRVIGLEVYIFAQDETGRAFADLLCRKAKEGVRVYVIYDSFGSCGFFGGEPEFVAQMRSAGVRVQQFHPMRPWDAQYGWRPVNRDHRKLLVIDDEMAGLGGLNIGREYDGSWIIKHSEGVADFWRDNSVGISGPAARLFSTAFAKTWNYIAHGGRIRRTEFIHNLYDGELGVLAPAPTMNSPLQPFLFRMLREARRSILMTMAYFAPDDPLIENLCKAARRGVRVRLMLPGRSDVPAVRICARAFYETLLSAGVEIYERQGVVLHAKTMVVDECTSVIGSTNLDYRSIHYNCELSAIIRNAEFGRQVCELFENDVRYATRIRLSEWRRRPFLDRAVQWAVSRARYVL